MDSIYQLRRPYDFLALIQQEERAKHVEQLKKELVEQKAHIDKNEDKVGTFNPCIKRIINKKYIYKVQYNSQNCNFNIKQIHNFVFL